MALSARPTIKFNHLSSEIMLRTFEFLTYQQLGKITSVCSLWKTAASDSSIWRNRYARTFPKHFKIISQPNYSALIGEIDWKAEFSYTYLRFCRHMYTQEFTAYVNAAAIDKNIEKLETIAFLDRHGNNIFDYLAFRKDKQAILDSIYFNVLVHEFLLDGTVDTEKTFSQAKSLHRIFKVDKNTNAYLLTVVACNQIALLNSYLKYTEITDDERLQLLTYALKYNHEDVFFNILRDTDIKILLNNLRKEKNKINISSSFASRLFEKLQKTDLTTDVNRRNILHWAVLLKQETYLETILKESKKLMYAKDCYQHTPLHYVCHHDVSFYQFLLKQGISPSEIRRVKPEEELIVYAARYNNVELLNCLMDRNPKRSDDILTAAMRAAVNNGHLDCVRLLINKQKHLTVENIINAVKYRHIHILEYVKQHAIYHELLQNPDVIEAIQTKKDTMPRRKFK